MCMRGHTNSSIRRRRVGTGTFRVHERSPREIRSPARVPGNDGPTSRRNTLGISVCLLFFGLHVGLGIAMKWSNGIATIHAALVLFIGLYFAWNDRSGWKVPLVVSYLAASEVLWRMTSASIFWEFGKYAIALILILWNIRVPTRYHNWLPLAYLALHLPSLIYTLTANMEPSVLRGLVSFNLSGPLSMAVCAFCLFARPVSDNDRIKIILAVLGPLVSTTAVCSLGTINLGSDYEFGAESNFETSGGYGPNQVSSLLGLGALLAFLWAQHLGQNLQTKCVAYGLVLCFLVQAALTFSRTGVWIAAATIATAALFLIGEATKVISKMIGIGTLLLVSQFVLLPALDQFTDGMLSKRFAEKGFSHREEIARGDVKLALLNPLLGVGPGMARAERTRQLGIGGAPHTEFTRVLAEHGSAGLLALGTLVAFGFQAYRRTQYPFEKAWSMSLLAYAALFMMVTGMRLVMPAIAVGLAALGDIRLFPKRTGVSGKST